MNKAPKGARNKRGFALRCDRCSRLTWLSRQKPHSEYRVIWYSIYTRQALQSDAAEMNLTAVRYRRVPC